MIDHFSHLPEEYILSLAKEENEIGDTLVTKPPSTSSSKQSLSVSKGLQPKARTSQPHRHLVPRHVTEHDAPAHSPVRGSRIGVILDKVLSTTRKPEHTKIEASSLDIPIKTAESIEIPRSSPQPILARPNLPKATFSSLEEYGEDYLRRPVCSARPSEDNGPLNGPNNPLTCTARNSLKQRNGISRAADHVDPCMSAVPLITLEKNRPNQEVDQEVDQEISSKKTMASSNLQWRLSPYPFQVRSFDNTIPVFSEIGSDMVAEAAEETSRPESEIIRPMLTSYINDMTDHHSTSNRSLQTPHHSRQLISSRLQEQHSLKSPSVGHVNHQTGKWCSNDPAATMKSSPERSCEKDPSFEPGLPDNYFDSGVYKPPNASMSPSSSLDDIIDGSIKEETKLSPHGKESTRIPYQMDLDLLSESSIDSLPYQHSDTPTSHSPGLNPVEPEAHEDRHRGRQVLCNDSTEPACAGKEHLTVNPSRSLNLCAGNSVELCDLIPETSSEELEQEMDRRLARQISMARKGLADQAEESQYHKTSQRGCVSTNRDSSGEEATTLPGSRCVNPDTFDENGPLAPFFVFSKVTVPQLSMPSANEIELELFNTPSPGRPCSTSPESSNFDFEDFFEDDDVASFPPGDKLETPKRPMIKPVVFRRKSEVPNAKPGGFHLDTVLRKRKMNVLPNHDAPDPREQGGRKFRQIKKLDSVIGTVFSKGMNGSKLFQPVKMYWQHGRWISEAHGDWMNRREEKEPCQQDLPKTSDRPKIEVNRPNEADIRKDSMMG